MAETILGYSILYAFTRKHPQNKSSSHEQDSGFSSNRWPSNFIDFSVPVEVLLRFLSKFGNIFW